MTVMSTTTMAMTMTRINGGTIMRREMTGEMDGGTPNEVGPPSQFLNFLKFLNPPQWQGQHEAQQ